MPYTPTAWVDDVTLVNATRMNKIEQGILDASLLTGIPADVAVAAAAFLIRNKLLAADAQPAFRLMGDGKIEWGPGGAGALDVNLYRLFAAYAQLATDSRFTVVNDQIWIKHNAGTLVFGATGDTNLYRSAAAVLKTDGTLHVGAEIILPNNAGNKGLAFIDTSYNYGGIRRDAATGNVEVSAQSNLILKPNNGLVQASALAITGGIGTAFPGSPVDGQLFTLVDSLTAPTYVWNFRYVAGITDAYKWLCIGGGPLLASVPGVDSTASTSYVYLGLGPTLTFPRAGIYDVEFGANVYMSGSGANATVGLSYNNAAVADVDSAGARLDSAHTSTALAVTAWRKTRWTVAAATTARMLAKTNANTIFIFARQVMAVPVRVA